MRRRDRERKRLEFGDEYESSDSEGTHQFTDSEEDEDDYESEEDDEQSQDASIQNSLKKGKISLQETIDDGEQFNALRYLGLALKELNETKKKVETHKR